MKTASPAPLQSADSTLVELPRHQPATVSVIDWSRLAEPEARRLRELGFDEGADVEVLHRGGAGGPVACRVGRMTVAIRRAVAAAIHVSAQVSTQVSAQVSGRRAAPAAA